MTNWTCDVLVIGSGGAGLLAAIAASRRGLRVLVIEKAAHVGGTTAISGGSLWVPANPVAARLGIPDSVQAGRAHLQQHLGSRFDARMIDRFLETAPEMVSFLERETDVRFYCQNDFPDFQPEWAGGMSRGGRTICAEPFYARSLGEHVAKLPLPLYTQTALGMMTTPRDLKHFQNFSRSWKSFAYVGRRMLQHQRDKLLYGRTMWLTNGNALVARLLKTAMDAGVELRLEAPATELIESNGRVSGAAVATPDGPAWVEARHGVVLACGGFGHDLARCQEWLPRPQADDEDWSMSADGHHGDALRMAQRVGAELARPVSSAALWAPVSRVPTLGGMLHGHYCDRSKPPVIAVTPRGQRFVNESESYHHFCEGLIRATPPGEAPVAYLVTDHRGLRRYGLGAVLAKPFPIARHLASGYLLCGPTLEALAQTAGIDGAALVRTMETYNRHAGQGEDPAFRKGGHAFNRHYGNSAHHPNPCVGPIDEAPFYAVRITVGMMGTLAGLRIDEHARVLRADHRAIPGLYAVGEAASHPFAGAIPGAGCMLSAGMTFGYLAGQDIGRAFLSADSADASPVLERVA